MLVGALLPIAASFTAPAGALPVDDVTFSEGHIDVGSYNMHDNPTAYWLQDTDNFGPTGTYVINSVTLQTQTPDVTPAYLSTVDVFYDGWVWNGTWDEAELDALVDWVDAGGVLIANEDHVDADDLGARFGLETTGSGASTGVVITPVATSHPMVDGPFGAWASLASAGTTGWFDPVPPEWTIIAEDDLNRAVLLTRTWGSGHVILTADEAIFRAAVAGHEVSTGNILAHAISLVDDGTLPLVANDPGDQLTGLGDAVALQIVTAEGNGSDITYAVDQLPSGLSIDADTGMITGTVDAAATTAVEVTATPLSGPMASVTFDWTVTTDVTPVAEDDVVVGKVGESLNLDICANDDDGNAPATAALVDPSPGGLTLSGCTLTGVPTASGQSAIGYELTDADGDTGSATVHVYVDPVDAPVPVGTCRPGAAVSLAGSVPGSVDAGDEFGGVSAIGDFNGDGEIDLAVGSPGDNGGAGAVTIFSAPCADGAGFRITQAGAVPGKNEAGDGLGTALAVGDFDNDGFDDLAIGVPGEDSNGRTNDGNVIVLYGSPGGIKRGSGEMWNQRKSRPGKAQTGDRLGSSLAAGDFDRDGRDDLLVGVPGEDVTGKKDAGAVMVFYGTDAGLSEARATVWKQWGSLAGKHEPRDRLGAALSAGDFNGDGFDDAVFAATGEDVGDHRDAGMVHILFGAKNGLRTKGQQTIKGTSTDSFTGQVMAAADLTGDGVDDLVIGADDPSHVGRVLVYAGASGAKLGLVDVIDQSDGNASSAAPGNRFGAGVAIVDFDSDGSAELAIGAPGEDVGGISDAGAVHLFDVSGTTIRLIDQRYRTKADVDTAGSLAAGAHFGANLVGGDGVLFAGAPGDTAGATVGAGSVTALVARNETTTYLTPNCVSSCTEHEYQVGVALQPGTYRTSLTAGSCLVATETAGGARAALTDVGDGTGILQVTPEHALVLIGTDCGGLWFFTSI